MRVPGQIDLHSIDALTPPVAADRPLALEDGTGQVEVSYRARSHGVLTPLSRIELFAVVDQVDDGGNLEELWFDTSFVIDANNECASEGLAQTSHQGE